MSIPASTSLKINWRVVVIHSIAIFFMAMASQQLAVLNDTALLATVEKYGIDEGMNQMKTAGNLAGRLANFNTWLLLSVPTGMLLGIILSVTIILNRKLLWINIVLIIIICIVTGQLGLHKNAFVLRIINLPAYLTTHADLKYKYVLTGIIPILISLVLFFNRRINSWVKRKQTMPAEDSILSDSASI